MLNPRGGGHLRDIWVGVCRRGLQTLTLLERKSVHFAILLKAKTFFRDQNEITLESIFFANDIIELD